MAGRSAKKSTAAGENWPKSAVLADKSIHSETRTCPSREPDMFGQPLWNLARGPDMSGLIGVFMVHLLSFIHG
jgi:hypothetical protein